VQNTFAPKRPEFAIVPNPSVSTASLFNQTTDLESMVIEIWDMKGIKIRPSIHQTLTGKALISLPEDLAKGTYLVKIKGDDFVKTLKWVVE